MFLIISKITSFLLTPLVWVCLLAVAAFVLKKWRKRLAVVTVAVFVLFSNQAIFTLVARWWEGPIVPVSGIDVADRPVVVLGGYCSYDSPTARTRFTQSADRLWQALMLKKCGTGNHLVLSGGAANVYRKDRGEGAVVAQALYEMGFDTSGVWVDSLSRNTYENSAETAKLLKDKKQPQEIVLVTSAWHMARAKGCFVRQGFDVVPFPTDYLSPIEPLEWSHFVIPSASTMALWEMLIREWVGVLAYRVKGYI